MLRSKAPLTGFVLLGLLATLSRPTAARAEVTEPQRALLGVVSTRAAAVSGNVEAVARPSLSGGEAALLGKGSGVMLLAALSAEPAAVAFGAGGGEPEQKTRFPGGDGAPVFVGRLQRRLRRRRVPGMRRRRRVQPQARPGRRAGSRPTWRTACCSATGRPGRTASAATS